MAYRDFRNEKTYEAPRFEGLPLTLQAIQQQNVLGQQNKKLKADEAKQRQEEMKTIAFENPEDFDKEHITKKYISQFLTDAQGHVRKGGSVHDEPLTQRRRTIDGIVAKSKSDAAMLAQGKDLVAQMPDWINKGAQTQIMKEAYAGEGRTVDNRDMSGLMTALDPTANPALFNQQNFIAKALENFKTQTTATNSSVEKGATTTGVKNSLAAMTGIRYNPTSKGYELDPTRRTEVINAFFETGGDLGGKTWATILQREAETEVEAEAARFLKAEKAKGRVFTDEEAQKLVQDFKIDPTLNPYSGGKRIADRVLDKAEKRILNQAQINRQYDYTQSQDEPRAQATTTGKEDKTPDLVITPGLYTGQAKSAKSDNMPYGAAGVTVMHKQKPLKITSTIPTTYTVKGGRKDNQNTERTFVTNKIQLMPVTKSGNLVFQTAKTQDELLKAINSMSDEMVLKLDPNMQLFFRGTFGERADTLNDGESASAEDIAAAVEKKRAERISGTKTTKELSDEFVPANDDMMGQVAAYGITREKVLTPEMQAVQAALTARYNKALERKQGAQNKPASGGASAAAGTRGSYWDKYKK